MGNSTVGQHMIEYWKQGVVDEAYPSGEIYSLGLPSFVRIFALVEVLEVGDPFGDRDSKVVTQLLSAINVKEILDIFFQLLRGLFIPPFVLFAACPDRAQLCRMMSSRAALL